MSRTGCVGDSKLGDHLAVGLSSLGVALLLLQMGTSCRCLMRRGFHMARRHAPPTLSSWPSAHLNGPRELGFTAAA